VHRLVIALVTLLGLTAGSFVAGYVLLLSSSTDRLAAMAPAGTAAYVNVYLEPSAGQQLNLAELIGRLPGFADAATLDAKVDQIIGTLLSGTGIDYQAEVKPWLGDQLAIAAWPAADGSTEAEAVVIMDVKDRPAADDALAGVLGSQSSGGASETYRGIVLQIGDGTAYAFVEDALVIGPVAASLHPIIDVIEGAASLAGRPEFAAAMSRIPADYLASIFVDVAALVGGTSQVDGLSTASAALIAEPEGLRLTGSLPFDGQVDGFADERSVVVDWMPSESVASAVIFGLPQTLEAVESSIGGTEGGGEVLSLLDTVRALAAFGLGLDVDADLFPLLDREAGLAITALGDDLPHGQFILRPADADAALAALDRIVDRLAAIGAEARTEIERGIEITVVAVPDVGDVAFAVVDGIVIVGLSTDDVLAAITAHEGDGTALSASDAYRHAFEVAGTHRGTEAFVDVGALVELGLLDEAGIGLPDDARDILSQLGAFGLAIPSRADSIEFHAAITVPDRSAE
jgi:hypothetical protein